MRKGAIHIIYTLFCAAAVCGLSSCSDDGYDGPTPRHDAGVAFMVSGISPQTRVDYNNYVSSTFHGGEELGAYVIERTSDGDETTLPTYRFMPGYTQNARYRVVEGSFHGKDGYDYKHALQPEVPMDTFPAKQRYVFYYPYKAGADIQNFSHTVLANQSTKEAFETSDLLRARVNGTTDESVVPTSIIGTEEATSRQLLGVTMEHVMASVVLKVESARVPENSVDREAKLLGMYCTVSGIDLTRALTPEEQGPDRYDDIPGKGENVDRGDITMWNSGTESPGDSEDSKVTYEIFRAVFPAQTVKQNVPFLSFLFNDDKEPKTYNMNVNGSKPLDFLPGKYYLFTLTKDGGLRFRGIIDDLEDGGDYFYEY